MYSVLVTIQYTHDDSSWFACYHCKTYETALMIYKREVLRKVEFINEHKGMMVVDPSVPIDELYKIIRPILSKDLWIDFEVEIEELKFED